MTKLFLSITRFISLFILIFTPTVGLASIEGSDQLQITTSAPKRNNETIFSTLVAWIDEEGTPNKSKGLVFIDPKKNISDKKAAKKIAKSLNAGINNEAPRARGAVVKHKDDEADFIISNTTGFDLTRVVIGDYTNQKLQYRLPGKNFNEVGVSIAVDLVFAAAVEYIDDFSAKSTTKAAGGEITVTIDKQAPIVIQTQGKDTRQLEKELDRALGNTARFSSTPIYPNFVELKSRNYKPFDGGETQIQQLNAKSLTIDVNDPSLGILTKFKFSGFEKKEESFESSVLKLVIFLIIASLGYVFYARKKSTADDQ